MGEKPVLTMKAHVFRIDPSTKKNWLPHSDNQAVPIVIYHDKEKGTYRIISFDDQQKVLVNSSMTGQMKITRSSSKFCQWTDSRVKMTYGLGFMNGSDMKQFVAMFEEAVAELKSSSASPVATPTATEKQLSLSGRSDTSTSGSTSAESTAEDHGNRQQEKAAPPQTAPKPSSEQRGSERDYMDPRQAGHDHSETTVPGSPAKRPGRGERPSSGKRSNLLSRLKPGSSTKDTEDDETDGRSSNQDLRSVGSDHDLRSPTAYEQGKTNSLKRDTDTSPKRQRKASISGPSKPDMSEQYSVLKKENDQLKIALATSSANAKSWETELQRLKHNNVRLTTALQESTSNVEEWKKQLTSYKEENSQLRQKVSDLELSQHQAVSLRQESERLEKAKAVVRDELESVTSQLRDKEQECVRLNKQVNILTGLDKQVHELREQVQVLSSEREELASKVFSLQDQLQLTRTATSIRLERLKEQHASLGHALREALSVHDQMEQDLQ